MVDRISTHLFNCDTGVRDEAETIIREELSNFTERVNLRLEKLNVKIQPGENNLRITLFGLGKKMKTLEELMMAMARGFFDEMASADYDAHGGLNGTGFIYEEANSPWYYIADMTKSGIAFHAVKIVDDADHEEYFVGSVGTTKP